MSGGERFVLQVAPPAWNADRRSIQRTKGRPTKVGSSSERASLPRDQPRSCLSAVRSTPPRQGDPSSSHPTCVRIHGSGLP